MVGIVPANITAKLVTARFCALIMHLIATYIFVLNKIPLIQLELGPGKSAVERHEQYRKINAWVITLVTLVIIFMAVEFIAVLSGYIVNQKSGNLLTAASHLVGSVATISMVFNGWTVRLYPHIFIFCSLLPAGYEVLWWALQLYSGKFRREKCSPGVGWICYPCTRTSLRRS